MFLRVVALVYSHWSSLFCYWPLFLQAPTSTSCTVSHILPHFYPIFSVYQAFRVAHMMKTRDCRRAIYVDCNQAALIQLAWDSEGTERWIDRELKREKKERGNPSSFVKHHHILGYIHIYYSHLCCKMSHLFPASNLLAYINGPV